MEYIFASKLYGNFILLLIAAYLLKKLKLCHNKMRHFPSGDVLRPNKETDIMFKDSVKIERKSNNINKDGISSLFSSVSQNVMKDTSHLY